MTTATTRTIRSGDNQMVTLPSEVAYSDDTELTIERKGDVVTMYPKRMYPNRMTPRQLVEELRKLPKPSSIEKRQPIVFPKRPGL